MRIRFVPVVLSLVLALALPCSASTVQRVAHASRTHHHHRTTHRASARAHRLRRTGRHAALPTRAVKRTSTIPAVARVRIVPPMRGSRASLLRQNERTTAEGMVRIQNNAQLVELRADHQLVSLPTSGWLRVNPDLPVNRRYCRPATARFLSDLARSHYARFRRPLQVNSAVRTVSFQRALMEINGNAAAAEGDLASPHLTGAAIDIGKKGLSLSEIAWLRAWLFPLQTAGKIDVEEEFYQACFHITVYSSYLRPAVPGRHPGPALLAEGLR